MVEELTISKGDYSVTLYARNIAENYTNKIFIITPAQSVANQASGPLDNKIVDLLRVNHQLVIKGYLTGTDSKTVKQVKEDLVAIFEGGVTAGGTIALVYDGDTLNGYVEKINFVEKAEDNQPTSVKDHARYEIALTFIEGVNI